MSSCGPLAMLISIIVFPARLIMQPNMSDGIEKFRTRNWVVAAHLAEAERRAMLVGIDVREDVAIELRHLSRV